MGDYAYGESERQAPTFDPWDDDLWVAKQADDYESALYGQYELEAMAFDREFNYLIAA